ncbi:hypothetical protein LZ009_04435 [Ramlibacter sp. XY19]|uniref:GH12 family glycosyl hydrolase domain-containing protein n=1 Tax=Ramlibacter paludis TaxID=2908000 RepID=UPI0023DB6EE3|nr:hypothetical protein [Ramlibacter paludis]MCG2592023.1 hypothetical protein [Ramlibacter paludis]
MTFAAGFSTASAQRCGALVVLMLLAVQSALAQTTCENFGFIPKGTKHVYNNVWGAAAKIDPVTGHSQCVAVDESSVRFEWRNFPSGRGQVKSYPHVTVGWDWDGKITKESIFPMGVARAESLQSDFAVEMSAIGRYNLGFDIWLSRTSKVSEPREELTHEIMIWTASQGMKQYHPAIGSLTVAGRTFDLHTSSTQEGKWRYIAYVAREPMTKGTLPVGAFFADLRRKGLLKGDEIIHGVSFGNEIVEGQGASTLRAFDVR